MIIKLIAISFTLTITVFNVLANSEIKVLTKQIALADTEAERGQLKYQLAKKYIAINTDSALHYGEEVIKIADRLKDRKLRAKALYLQGYIYDQVRNIEQAIFYYSNARLDYQYLQDYDLEEKLLKNLVNLAHENNAFEIGEHYSKERIKLIPKLNNYLRSADIYYDIGLIYQQNDQLEKAKLQFMHAKLELDQHINPKDSVFYAEILLELGIINRKIGSDLLCLEKDAKPYFEEALYYYDRVLRINPTLTNKAKIANNRGNLWLSQRDNDQAYDYFLTAKSYMEEVGSKRLLTVLYNNLGIVHFEANRLDSAHYYFSQSARANLLEKSIVTNLRDISLSINFYLGDELTKSISYLDQINLVNPSLTTDFTAETVAYYNKQIEKEKVFKIEQIKVIYEQGYAALKKEYEVTESVFSKKEQMYIIGLASGLALSMLVIAFKQYRKYRIRKHNRKVISDMNKKLQ